MERKLVLHGQSTLMVSLPAKWIKRHNLAKGDSVKLADEGQSLAVTLTHAKKDTTTVDIHFTHPNYDTVRAMLCKYQREGVDQINVTFKDKDTILVIYRILSFLFSYQVIDSKPNSCIIKNIAKEYDFDFDALYNKIDNITAHLFTLTKEMLQGQEAMDLEKLKLHRDEAWKLRNMAYSAMRKETIQDAFIQTHNAHMIEQNCTFLSWIIKHCTDNDIQTVSKEFLQLYKAVHKYWTDSTKLMKKADETYLNHVLEQRRVLVDKTAQLASKGGKEAQLCVYLGMLIQNIHAPKAVLIS